MADRILPSPTALFALPIAALLARCAVPLQLGSLWVGLHIDPAMRAAALYLRATGRA